MNSYTRNLVKRESDGICIYCGRDCWNSIKSKRSYVYHLTVDHIIPLSRGGTTTRENLTVCCYRCNLIKNDMTDEEFRYFMQTREVPPSYIEWKISNGFVPDYDYFEGRRRNITKHLEFIERERMRGEIK